MQRAWNVQQAVYAALNGNLAGLDSVPCPVYDRVPTDAALPYVKLDSGTTTSDDQLDAKSDVHILSLSVWSSYQGQQEVLQILGQIDGILDGARLIVDGQEVTRCDVNDGRSVPDIDGETYQGAVIIRILLDQI